jgi:ATP-dependent RNA helicase RhlE
VAEAYVHRIGRTARAGAEGQAISLCDVEERSLLKAIEKLIRQPIPVETRNDIVVPDSALTAKEERRPRGGRPQGGQRSGGQGQRQGGSRDGGQRQDSNRHEGSRHEGSRHQGGRPEGQRSQAPAPAQAPRPAGLGAGRTSSRDSNRGGRGRRFG